MNNLEYANSTPKEIRELIRRGVINWNTSGMCAGYAQANLVILPKKYAYDFLLFAQRNPKSCPILEVLDVGSKVPKFVATESDISLDFPKYRIFKDGVLIGEYDNVSEYWRDDLVSFLIGCSFSFEAALLEADVPVRQIEEGKNVPMYMTNIDCVPAGVFSGKMVVSMRPIPHNKIVKAVTITGGMPRVHGSPIHIGNPDLIGIKNINKPEFGDAVTINEGETPIFWCCGVTPQSIVMNSKPDFVITHTPGHMYITDVKNIDLKD